ncbi:MAG TPA: hypothetical protein VLJ86_11725, partial [Ramlibacter sp.]|nr:hypothetical protein [Ramlibacter sp.]
MEASSVQASVRRRRVHYFSGFDPRGAGYYHQLLREEGARPQPSGARVDTGPRVRLGAQLHAWPVRWSAPGSEQAVETEHLFMGWNDVIRAHWLRGPLALIGGFVRTYCAGAARLGLGKARAFYPPALLTTLLPLLFFGGTALLGLVVALLAAWALPHGFGWVAAVAGFALATGLWAAGARANLFWLVRIFNFIRVLGEAPLPPLTARSAEWLETIVLRQQQDPVDEVLLVGHSVGAIVMVETADALMRDARWQAAQPGGATGVVMLGQCIP